MVCATSPQIFFVLVITYILRTSHSLVIDPLYYARTNASFYSFVPHTISAWNSLHQQHVTAPSLSAFKYYFNYKQIYDSRKLLSTHFCLKVRLEQGEMIKYLGVLLSHDLSWGEHVQSICSKAIYGKILGLLYRRFYSNAPGSALLQLYISLVRPHLDYASAIWSPYLSKDKTEIENVQKFACHMATRLWDSSSRDLLELADLPTLECRRLETRLSLPYKLSTNSVTLMKQLST